MSKDVPVNPVCQIVPAGQLPQALGRTLQPSTRGSPPKSACRAVIRAIISAVRTGCRPGRSSALAYLPRSPTGPKSPA
jgi:hypothetical protein